MKPELGTPVKHLLVDLDGTLLGNQSLPLSIDFLARAIKILKEYGGMRKAASVLLDIRREFGSPSSSMPRANDLRVVELVSRRLNLSLEEARLLLRESVLKIFPSLEKHFYPIPGSKEFLDWAKDRYPLTLATNPVWPPEVVQMRVKWAGIDPAIFGFITHVRLMHSVKPHAEYYEQVLALQNLSASDCLLIGNDMKMDLPATRVGIRVFIVVDPKKTHSDLTIPAHPQARAAAWKGTYSDLRKLLETQPPALPVR